jgi:hypothetical protein
MAELPDVSDLLQSVRKAQIIKDRCEAAELAARDAIAEVVERYKRAGVPDDECDHPLYCHRSGDSVNLSSYSQQPKEGRTRGAVDPTSHTRQTP